MGSAATAATYARAMARSDISELLPDGDLGGIAVHAAARVCDAAGPHQVLVSRTLADLAAGSDFRFEDRGHHEIRGVPGSWTLYEVMK